MHERTLEVVREAFQRALTPPDPIMVSEWADRYRMLSGVGASEPGRYRTDRTPYMREIMDSLSILSPVKRVVFMKPSRIGGSEGGNNFLGYVIDNAPGPFMLVSPGEGPAKRYVDQKINPLIEGTPRIRDRQRQGRGPSARFSKVFDACVFMVANAASAMTLRMLDARFLMCDEVDAYPHDVDGEGDPLDIALKRTATFGARAKQYIVSTPLIKGTSRVEHYYLLGDRRLYFVPCPHCNAMQALEWAQLRWPEGQPRKAVYLCVSCARAILDQHKTAILLAGEWRPTAEGDGETRSYRLNSLYTPNGWDPSFGQLAQEWTKAQRSTAKLKVFVNQALAQTWQEKGEAPEWERLYERREDYPIGRVPEGAAFIAAGVDVQANRLEGYVWAFGPGKESWLVEHRVLEGDPFNKATFAPLTTMLGESWNGAGGVQFQLAGLGIDSNYATEAVLDWARTVADPRVMVVRGDHHKNWTAMLGAPTLSDRLINGKPAGVMMWPVGGALIKQEFYGFLRQAVPLDGQPYPAGFVHLPKVDAEVIEQLVAEHLVTKIDKKGFPVQEWVKKRDRNEALDCRVYAHAVAEKFGMSRWTEADWQVIRAQQGIAPKTPPPPPPPRKSGGFLSTPRQRARGSR